MELRRLALLKINNFALYNFRKQSFKSLPLLCNVRKYSHFTYVPDTVSASDGKSLKLIFFCHLFLRLCNVLHYVLLVLFQLRKGNDSLSNIAFEIFYGGNFLRGYWE